MSIKFDGCVQTDIPITGGCYMNIDIVTCVPVLQTKRSNIQLSSFSHFITDMYNARSVIIVTLYLMKLEVFLFASIFSYSLL